MKSITYEALGESIRERVEAHGAKVKFLPAYSPEFNPIEECWSKVKAWVKKKAARTIAARWFGDNLLIACVCVRIPGGQLQTIEVLELASGLPRSGSRTRSCPVGSSMPTSTASNASRRSRS